MSMGDWYGHSANSECIGYVISKNNDSWRIQETADRLDRARRTIHFGDQGTGEQQAVDIAEHIGELIEW